MLNKTTESDNPIDQKEKLNPAKLEDKEIRNLEQRQKQHRVVTESGKQKLEEAGKKLEEAEELEKARKLKAEKLEAEELDEELFKIREYKAEKLGIEESEADEVKINEGNKLEIEDLLQPVKRPNFATVRESYSSARPSVDVSFGDPYEDTDLIVRKKVFNFKEPDFLLKKLETLKKQPEISEDDLEIDQEMSNNKSPENKKLK